MIRSMKKIHFQIKNMVCEFKIRKSVKFKNKVIIKLIKKNGYSYNGNIKDKELYFKFLELNN